MTKIYLYLLTAILLSGCSKKQNSEVLVIVEKGINSVGFYTTEGHHIKSIKLDTFPHEMRLSADRKFAYITNNGSLRFSDSVSGGETISVINLTTLEKEDDIVLAPYRRPHGIDIDPVTGYIVAGVENPDKVLLIDPLQNKIIKEFDCLGVKPHMVTISKGAKWLYISNVISGNLVGVNTTTGENFSIDVGFKPQESVLSEDESLLFVGCDKHISVIDLNQRKEIHRIPNGTNRMDLVHDGKMLVFSSTKWGIGFADAETFEMLYHIDIPYKPYSMHVSDDENLAYVAAEEQDVVYTIDLHKKQIVRKFRTAKGVRPDPVMKISIPLELANTPTSEIAALPEFTRMVIDTSFYKAYQIKSADLNGDRKPDLIAVSDRLPEVVWYENPSWKKHILLHETERNIDIAPYDIDKDGDVDIALACRFNSKDSQKGGYVYWLENPGDNPENLWKKHLIDSVPTSHRLKWADLDGDKTLELVNLPLTGKGSEFPDYKIGAKLLYYVVPTNPAQEKWLSFEIDSSLHIAHGLHIQRWDDDLLDDVFTASTEGINAYLPEIIENGIQWNRKNLVKGKTALSDYNGSSEVASGRIDEHVFLASIEPWHGNELVLYTKNEKTGWIKNVIDTTFNNGHALVCVDLNYDHYDEIIAGHRGEPYNLYIYQYQTTNGIWQRYDLDTGRMSAAGVHVFDANTDGLPDIVACGSFTGNVVLYLSEK